MSEQETESAKNFFVENNKEFQMQDNHGPHQSNLVHIIFLREPVTVYDVIPFVIFFSCWCLVIHTVMSIIKKLSKNTHSALQFFFIIAFPPLVMLLKKDMLFMFQWIVLIAFFLYCLHIAFSRESLMRFKRSKKIYRTFKFIFTYTNLFIFSGQLIFLFSVIFSNPRGINLGLRWLGYSLYFAVFCRETMSSLSIVIGKTSGAIASTPLGFHDEDPTKCMICNDTLINSKESVFTNGCGHSFHTECVKGWVLVASKDYCILCHEKIDVENSRLKKDLWMKTEVAVKPLMNFLRSTISFFVVCFSFILIRLKN